MRQFPWRWTTFEETKARRAARASPRTKESPKGRRKERASQKERAHGKAVRKGKACGRKEDWERKGRAKRKEKLDRSLEHATIAGRLDTMPKIVGAAREWHQLRRRVEELPRLQANRDRLQ